MTSLSDALVAFVVAFALNALLTGGIRLRTSAAEGSFLTSIYLSTLVLRMLLAVVLNSTSESADIMVTFWGDSGTYDSEGDLLARRWHGENTTTVLTNTISGYGFVYGVASLYYLFGRNQLLVQFVNATIGSLTVIVIYAIANRLFGRSVARLSASFMAFFPQMVFWSAGLYKDPSVLLCIALAMYAVICLREEFSPKAAVLLAVSAFGLLVLRFYVFYFVTLAVLATFMFGMRGRLGLRLLSYALVVVALLATLSVAVSKETLEIQGAYMSLSQLQVTRSDQAMWGQSAYGQDYDVSTPMGALRALPVGLVYLLFAPFPWSLSGLRQLLTLPETWSGTR
jgi:4-amino-4-deoxy-L-arabinose transferase-like glycosyltransferase